MHTYKHTHNRLHTHIYMHIYIYIYIYSHVSGSLEKFISLGGDIESMQKFMTARNLKIHLTMLSYVEAKTENFKRQLIITSKDKKVVALYLYACVYVLCYFCLAYAMMRQI